MQKTPSRCRASNGLRPWWAAASRSNWCSSEVRDGMYGCDVPRDSGAVHLHRRVGRLAAGFELKTLEQDAADGHAGSHERAAGTGVEGYRPAEAGPTPVRHDEVRADDSDHGAQFDVRGAIVRNVQLDRAVDER